MTTPHLISAALAAGLATLFTLPIRADEPPEKAQPVVTVDVGVVTAVPVMVAGAQAIIEGPFGLQLRGELGWLGTPYVEAIDAFLLGVGAYGSGPTADATSDLIRAGIQDSLTARIAVGIRPFPTRGFEAYVGYTLNALGGHLGGKESVEAVTDKTSTSTRHSRVFTRASVGAGSSPIGSCWGPRSSTSRPSHRRRGST